MMAQGSEARDAQLQRAQDVRAILTIGDEHDAAKAIHETAHRNPPWRGPCAYGERTQKTQLLPDRCELPIVTVATNRVHRTDTQIAVNRQEGCKPSGTDCDKGMINLTLRSANWFTEISRKSAQKRLGRLKGGAHRQIACLRMWND
jgi:hypothetical protein